MPTHLSLPERYPVLEHAEARLEPPPGPGAAGRQESGRSGRESLLGLLAGGTGGALIAAVVVVLAERAG